MMAFSTAAPPPPSTNTTDDIEQSPSKGGIAVEGNLNRSTETSSGPTAFPFVGKRMTSVSSYIVGCVPYTCFLRQSLFHGSTLSQGNRYSQKDCPGNIIRLL